MNPKLVKNAASTEITRASIGCCSIYTLTSYIAKDVLLYVIMSDIFYLFTNSI